MKGIFALLALTIGLSRCADQPVSVQREPATTDSLIIRTGTSFGYCIGYCRLDYTLTPTQITLLQMPNAQPAYPTKTCQRPVQPADWTALEALADFDTFDKQPESLGCPDCADGGAEYVELQRGGQKHRVTFEYGKTIPGFEALVDALRRQRTLLKTCP